MRRYTEEFPGYQHFRTLQCESFGKRSGGGSGGKSSGGGGEDWEEEDREAEAAEEDVETGAKTFIFEVDKSGAIPGAKVRWCRLNR